MFVSRFVRLLITAVLAVGSVAYVAIRAGNAGSRAEAATTPPTIVIPRHASTRGYLTKTVKVAKGHNVRVVNHDDMRHTVTSVAKDRNGSALFGAFLYPGTTATLLTSKLAPGRYRFFCFFHPRVMQGTLIVTGTGGGTTGSPQRFDIPLFIPRVLTGSHLTLAIKKAPVQVFASGPKTVMWTYGGSYPGPTIRRPAGQDTKITFVDQLPASTRSVSVHLHGDHHTWQNDGQPLRFVIPPAGGRRTYDYPLRDGGLPERAGFFYYHDHRMLFTGRNNWMGMQGVFIVDNGAAENHLRLPAGGYDVPIVVADRSFTAGHQLRVPFPTNPTMETMGPAAPPGDGTVGDHILVNGRFAPHFDVATHRYRLRLLNSSNFQSYDFVLSDGRSFTQIGTGDSLLPAPVVRRDIFLGPAQRADVVVNFGGEFGKRVVLKSIARVGGPKIGAGSPTAPLMQFRVTTRTRDFSRVPATLRAAPPIQDPNTLPVAKTWTIDPVGHNSMGSYWQIDGRPFAPRRVSYLASRGSTEKWRLVNNSSVTHFFHIHEEQWHTVLRDGKTPPRYEWGLQDTWRLDPGESVVVEAKFTDYDGVFMIHCHMLDHEDHGLMAQFAVVEPGTTKLPPGYFYQP